MTPQDDDPTLLVHAYLDGELDPANALAFEQRLARDPALAAECDRIEALRDAIREKLPREPAPAALRTRIETMVGLKRPRGRPSWRTLAASVVIAGLLASGSTWLALGPRTTDTVQEAVLADHIRGLMAPAPADILSSDMHTVKPWFNGRIPESPRVVDLATRDFPLVGGRIDVVGQTPVPTLVYRHRKHLISLTAVPAPGHAEVAPARREINGYHMLRWTEGEVTYWAVSDVAAADLETFADLFRTGTPER